MANTKTKKLHHYLPILGAVVVLLGVCALGYAYYMKHNSPKVMSQPTATIHQLQSHAAANNGQKVLSPTSQVNQGSSTDNHGTQTDNNTPSSQWTQSQSGVITLKQPTSNASLKSGDTVSGSASVGQVEYRLIDDKVGVISQGFISVNSGNFSATINFHSYAQTGRLDIFSTSTNGAEINEVQIPVNFGS